MGTGSFSKQIVDTSTRYYDINIINDAYDKILSDYNNSSSTIATLHSIVRGIPIIFGIKNTIAIIIAYKYHHKLGIHHLYTATTSTTTLSPYHYHYYHHTITSITNINPNVDNKWIYNNYINDNNNTSYYVNRDDFILILRMSFICNHIFDLVPEIINNINDLLNNGKPLLISKDLWLEKVSKYHNYDLEKVSYIQGYNNLVKFDELCNHLATTLLPNIDNNNINNQSTLHFKAIVQDIVNTSINDALFNLVSNNDSNLKNIKGLLKNLKIEDLEMINKHIDSEVLSARKIEKLITQSAPNTYRK